MRISAVDPFYLRMDEVSPAADGTQDTFLVRIRTEDGMEAWGESDASPLVSLAVYCCPPSHANIVSLRDSLIGETLEGPEDLRRIRRKALRNALDIQQAHHAWSAADIALWDLVGKKLGEPVWRLLDGPGAKPHPKRPYASMLFGDTPGETRDRARAAVERGFRAAKFGWGPMGKAGPEEDLALVRAAREGLGEDPMLYVDAGVAWGTDDATAWTRAVDFARYNVGWLEEPLLPDAVDAYARLKERRPPIPIAGGEGSGRVRDAEDLMDNGGVDFIQIDVGRVGGITAAHEVRKLAEDRGVHYVNHTFKSHLSLAASIHVFAAAEGLDLLEYVVGGSALSASLTTERLERGGDGRVRAPEAPGLGVTVDPGTLRRYLRPVRIEVDGGTVFSQAEA